MTDLPDTLDLFINLMILQTLMGAFDTIYHHELVVALPRQASARLELSIHSARALLYALVFAGLAWFEWHGLLIIAVIAIIVVEILLTLWDFVIEDRSRLLPASERVTHTLLAINGGATFVLLAVALPDWYQQPTGLMMVDYGWRSWFLTAGALGITLSGLRDGFAAWQVQRLQLALKLDLGGHQRLLISGGTGFIGSALCRELLQQGHQLTLLTHRPLAAAMQFAGRVTAVRDLQQLSAGQQFDAVINLAGAPVVGPRWNAARKRVLLHSRIDTTKQLLRFVKRAEHRPAVWIQASATGIYGNPQDPNVNEDSPAGDGFAAELCRQWEHSAAPLQQLGIRRVVLRFGLVFGRSGGALPMMMMPYRFGLGAVIGTGEQRVSWIHIEDLLRLMALAIRDPAVTGVINAVAPDCPSQQQFAGAVAHQLQRPLLFRLPATLLQRLLGEMAGLFVNGPTIVPRRLIERRFEYRFPTLRSALMDLS
jgi:hypothetical protein